MNTIRITQTIPLLGMLLLLSGHLVNAQLIEVKSDALEKTLKSHPRAFVYFYTQTCGPCKWIEPTFNQLVDTYTDITFMKVDSSVDKEMAHKYGANGYPAFASFVNGQWRKENQVSGANDMILRSAVKRLAAIKQ